MFMDIGRLTNLTLPMPDGSETGLRGQDAHRRGDGSRPCEVSQYPGDGTMIRIQRGAEVGPGIWEYFVCARFGH
jgi:hypothetical protein